MTAEQKAKILLQSIHTALQSGAKHFDPDTHEPLTTAEQILACLKSKGRVEVESNNPDEMDQLFQCITREFLAEKAKDTDKAARFSIDNIHWQNARRLSRKIIDDIIVAELNTERGQEDPMVILEVLSGILVALMSFMESAPKSQPEEFKALSDAADKCLEPISVVMNSPITSFNEIRDILVGILKRQRQKQAAANN